MNKQQLIKAILDNSKIHHNIYVDYQKVRKAITALDVLSDDEKEKFNDNMWIEGEMIEDFKRTFEDIAETPLNDSGNRNIGDKCEIKGEIWQSGRMGATLYWDAYWNSNNSGFGFIYDEYDLNEKEIYELKDILKDINEYNTMIDKLMINYYEELEFQAKEYVEQVKADKKQAKYQAMIAPYEVNLFELSKSDNQDIKRIALSLIKLLKIK